MHFLWLYVSSKTNEFLSSVVCEDKYNNNKWPFLSVSFANKGDNPLPLERRKVQHISLFNFFHFLIFFIMALGTVKWFNDSKGFGFITADDGENLSSLTSPLLTCPDLRL